MQTVNGTLKQVITTGRAAHMEYIGKQATKGLFTAIKKVRAGTFKDCGQKFIYEFHKPDLDYYIGAAYQANHGLDYSINRVSDLFLNACELAINASGNKEVYVKIFVGFDARNCNPKHTTIEKAQADHTKATAALKAKLNLFAAIKPDNLKFVLMINGNWYE